MKKRTVKPFYDKTCQRLEARARTATAASLSTPHTALAKHFRYEASACRSQVAKRLEAKRTQA